MFFTILDLSLAYELINLGKFFTLTQISKKGAKLHNPEYSPPKKKNVQGSDLAHFFGDWSQSEKFSEIKQPLVPVLQTWTFSK